MLSNLYLKKLVLHKCQKVELSKLDKISWKTCTVCLHNTNCTAEAQTSGRVYSLQCT